MQVWPKLLSQQQSSCACSSNLGTECFVFEFRGARMAPMIVLGSGANTIRVVVQPVVLFSICDAYIRRSYGQKRVIGTLLGTVEAGGVIELRSSYAIPFQESADQVQSPKHQAPCQCTMPAISSFIGPAHSMI